MNPIGVGYLLGLGVAGLSFLAYRQIKLHSELQSLTWKVDSIEGRLPKLDPYAGLPEMPPMKVVVVEEA